MQNQRPVEMLSGTLEEASSLEEALKKIEENETLKNEREAEINDSSALYRSASFFSPLKRLFILLLLFSVIAWCIFKKIY